jgi:hypothetical protein
LAPDVPCRPRYRAHLQRVDRIHLEAGGQQGLHPRPPVGLDPDDHLRRLPGLGQILGVTQLIRDQRVQPGQALHSLEQPPANQSPTLLIDDLDVVMALGPVIPTKITARSPLFTVHSRPGGGPAAT